MSPPPTLDIEALDRMEKAATPGPWKTAADSIQSDDGRLVLCAYGAPAKCGRDEDDYYRCEPIRSGDAEVRLSKEDREFMIAYRNSAPALIEAARERDRLKDALDVVEGPLAPEMVQWAEQLHEIADTSPTLGIEAPPKLRRHATLEYVAQLKDEIFQQQSIRLAHVVIDNLYAEITRLCEALKAAEGIVAERTDSLDLYGSNRGEIARHRSCLALIRSALGTDGEGK